MIEEQEKKPSRMRGAAALILGIAIVLSAAMWFGKADEASTTPCQLYARTVSKALDNCHSGRNRSSRHHIKICKQNVNPTKACLSAIRALSCDELERSAQVFASIDCHR